MKTIVLSLGGSLIWPDDLDTVFLEKFRQLISRYAKKNYRFAIICGGGKIARVFQQIASQAGKLGNDELDWLGIHATKLNSHIVRSMFNNEAEDFIVEDPTKKLKMKKKIVIASGWKPGWSTDYDAVLLAKNFGAREVINMSNIDYVFDKDPKKHPDAKKIEKISWHDYSRLISKKWKAGLNAPFDPVASKAAQKYGMKASIIGKDLKNLQNLLDGRKFRGTIIS